ncbi:isopenicillin N synthase family dioxygenase [Jatrophihabitans endophyticus]|uniref:isopenicillin N synthase family dioxygenase n=1 Tax=Jatrophihabitans endophyticus TaxID=1206085 RepID=UPI0009FCBA18|nr:2-oxoglutarate and iron-dependent oxygenase domain-containing protein [Jatrophihabitans endophyticus]
MHSLPVVDVAAVGDAAEAAQAEQLDLACRHVGLFEVVGHGIPREDVVELFRLTREFFALPAVEKAAVAQPAPDQVRGWSPAGSEGIAYSLDEESPADLKEKLDMGRPHVDAADPYYDPARSGPHLAPNLWPVRPRELRPAWEGYWQHLDRVCAILMRLTALSFELPDTWFADKIDRSISMLRALHYPHQHEPPLAGQLRAGAHTDYGAFTVVTGEDAPGGLQVLERDGGWVSVTTTPGRLVVGVGDLLAEWTADVWPATLHRVVNPPRGLASDASRLAFAFYQHPNYDVEVDVLPSLLSHDRAAAAPRLTAGDHLRHKYVRQTTFGRA